MRVVITGASAGVGRATARAFAKTGASVALLARGIDGLESARREVEALGGRALLFSVDVADYDQVRNAANKTCETFGGIDIWINNAMVSVFSTFQKMTAQEFRRVTEVTYLGYVHGTMAALECMAERGGVIVQVGSSLAHRGIPVQSAYCGAKHAIKGFTESLRCELMHQGSPVRITSVDLPALNTPQFSWVKSTLHGKPQPIAPIYQPEIAAEAIVWAAEHTPREMSVGFTTAVIKRLNQVVPRWIDWYLSKTAVESQQMKIPDDPARNHNLWKPVPGDAGAHGEFDSRSQESSVQLWARMHLKNLAWFSLASFAFAGFVQLRRTKKSKRSKVLTVFS